MASKHLASSFTREELLEMYSSVMWLDSVRAARQRRLYLRSLCKSFGDSVRIGVGVQVMYPETFEIGSGVFIGNGVMLQGRHDGRFVLGSHSWIGPMAYFDCRDLQIGEYVGWGPGAKVLGSEHTAEPTYVPIIQTDLVIRPVRIQRWADVGVNVVVLPGVLIGEGSIIGAGAVVTDTIPDFVVAAGVPARVIRRRKVDVLPGDVA